jgi:hypothetical protein
LILLVTVYEAKVVTRATYLTGYSSLENSVFCRHASCSDIQSCNYFDFSGKDLQDARVLTDVGDVPIQEIRDCGVDDHRLMNVIGESVKLVMEEVFFPIYELLMRTLSNDLVPINIYTFVMLNILFLSIDYTIM